MRAMRGIVGAAAAVDAADREYHMNMPMRLFTAIALLWSGAASAQGAGDGLGGRWQPQDDALAVVGIVCQAGTCNGRLEAHPKHPDRVGMLVLDSLRWQADTQRWKGRVYAARLDRMLDAEVLADGGDRFVLEVSTWLGKRKVAWQRLPVMQ